MGTFDNQKQSPFACNMEALSLNERPLHIALIKELFQIVQSVSELNDGYAFELPNTPEMLDMVTRFISKERFCCPFFGFAIVMEPESTKMWLQIKGRDGIKPFIRAEFGRPLINELLKKSSN